LRRKVSFCYICKVLVDPGTPYLGHDVRTATPLVARAAREGRSWPQQKPEERMRAASKALNDEREIINFIG
jgi:hypothetical protein